MANGEQKRIVKYKRIVDPSDPDPQNPTNYIDVPCITDIWFLSNDGQMYRRTFDSTANNTLRKIHVFTVANQTRDSSGNVTSDDSDKVEVERIDQIQVQNGDWYEYLNLSNDDDNPSQVRKTHVLRYNQANKNDATQVPWVDIEVIDEFTIQGFLKQTHTFKLGETDASQINIYRLTNDPGTALNNDDGSDPRSPLWSDNTYWGDSLDALPLDTNGNPDPVRLDPFQNIVNINWQGVEKGISLSLGFNASIYQGDYTGGGLVSFSSTLPLVQSEMSANADVAESIPYGKNTLLGVHQTFNVSLSPAHLGVDLIYGASSKSGSYKSMLGGNNVTMTMTVTVPEGSMFGVPRQGTWAAGASIQRNDGGAQAQGKDGSYGSYSGPFFPGGTGPSWILTGATATITAHFQIDPPHVTLNVDVG